MGTNTFFKDALPISISGPVGTGTVSLLDLLKQTYGDDASKIQNVSIFTLDAAALAASNLSYWDPNNKVLTHAVAPAGVDLGNIDAAHFKDVQIVIGNNIAPNLFLTVPESFTPATGDFVGHNLAITALPQQLDAPFAPDHIPTAADIVSTARMIATAENGVANANDCHNIASAIAASAGATLDSQSANTTNVSANEESGFWRIAYRGNDAAVAVDDWQSKVQAGDIVRMQRTDGGVHTVTVTAGLNADGNHPGQIQVVDNSNAIISEHWQDYDNNTVRSSVTIYRLTTDGVYLNDQHTDGHNNTILGSQFNDAITAGIGNDTLSGGKGGNDTLDGGNGDDTAVFHGQQSDYKVTVVNATTAILTDQRAGSPDGTDTIKNIEHVQFGDGKIVNLADLKTTAEPAPVAGSVAISDVNITEGNNGSQIETFTLTRTGGNAAFDVNFATADGSATAADGDYVAKTGSVHFDAGVNTQTVSIVVNGDTKVEANESFNVNLSGATNGATIAKAQGVSTIINDDVAPVAGSVAISDVNIVEGNNGSQIETFTVTRTGGSAAFDVNFATADGSATAADGDYVAKTGSVHFDAGVNTQTVSIVVNGDTKVEANETFNVNLSGATNGATIAKAQGVSTIINDDVAPVAGSVAISDVNITEGNNGSQIETFTLTRTGGNAAFDVNFATADGSATVADGDYVAKTGSVHFDAGVNTQTISIVVNGDTKVEANESFNVNLSGATNGATIAKAQGVSTIINDDVAPVAGSVAISDVNITEGNNGSQIETFTVTRTGGNAVFDVNFATADGSATVADGDYVAKTGSVHFDAGVNTQTVSIVVNGDTKVEANESFNVNLSGATNGATIAKAQGVSTIINDDAAPVAGSVAISDVNITEGNNGSQIETFTVTRTGGNAAFDVNFATADGSATVADGDYVAKAGSVHFDAGVNTQTISIVVDGDTKVEANETFNVNLSGATNGATIAKAQGVSTIVNDDVAPVAGSVSIGDATITEGDNGTRIETFTVTRTGGSAAFDVHYATQAGSASGADGDYVAKGGDLHFDAGVNTQTVSIVVNADTKVEANETFNVNLSAATNGAIIADGQGVGTIVNDDVAATVHVANDFNGDGISDVLFRNSNGSVAVWELNGNHIDLNATVGSAGSNWHEAGIGDFNGDGKADLLWRSDQGGVAMWQMDGNHIASNTTVGSASSDWKILDVADFSGDGKADILWENSQGQVAMWQMNGDHIASNTSVGSVGTDWHVIGTDDFNGDGKADILWENSQGKVAMWQMDGDHIASNTSVGSVGSNWHAAGTGDFNGDGKADVLWQNDQGGVAMWQMNGDHIASNTTVGSAPGWSVISTGDYNHDGKADVLWQNASGNVAEWQMDGDHIAANLTVGSHSIDWHAI